MQAWGLLALMTTKLTRLCESFIEAGWLAALIIVPLFFNVHSSRVFEPDKLSLLRSLALLMAVAWLIKWINDGFRLTVKGTEGAEDPQEQPSLWQRIRGTPLVLPTLILVVVYLIATIFSVTPRISWWGSYQRLQGTYTTLSYIVIFFLVLGHLRRPEQWQRLVHVVILTSLPIAIYGLLQRTGLDPLPWGGPTQLRVAANMGNSIFVAAYLLMAYFLTLMRLIEHFSRLLRSDQGTSGVADAILAGSYLFISVVQVVTMIPLTQSRGPFLGWFAGLFVFVLLILLGMRTRVTGDTRINAALRVPLRWAWAGWMGLAVLGLAFLVVFNLPNSPLAGLRDNRYIGRLGTALDFESNTAQVRLLIWEGVVDLVPPHEPLEYPPTDGQGDVTAMTPDRLNALRPLIGYGPESMWVAFNRFYPPDLAHHEDRNASPDRSHNETFDALVITGIIGFLAYMLLFLSFFYYALKWLGLIRARESQTDQTGSQRSSFSSPQGLLFVACAVVGAILGSVLTYSLVDSWVLLGLGLPSGLMVGIILYIVVAAIWNEFHGRPMGLRRRELILIALLATVIGHFIEIHFGIAIAATRTYFWVFAATTVVLGMGWLKLGEQQVAAEAAALPMAETRSQGQSVRSRRSGRQKKRRRPAEPLAPPRSVAQWNEVLVYAVLLGLILFTLAYDFVVNSNVPDLQDTNPFALLWHGLTTQIDGNVRYTSLGILWMIVFTWLIGLILTLFGLADQQSGSGGVERLAGRWLGKAALVYSVVSVGIFILFGLIHAFSVVRDARIQAVPGVSREALLGQIAGALASHIVIYLILSFVLIVAAAWLIWLQRPGASVSWLGARGPLAVGAGAVLLAGALAVILAVNVNLVQADIVYKIGQAYDSAGQFDNAIFFYEEAIDKQPSEDYYYLFLGRAQLEQAQQLGGPDRERYLRLAEQSLLRAQELNPLNTDHTANLGRLYLTWAQMADEPDRSLLIQRALDYYQVATSLSPNAAHLHNEYGTAYQVAGDGEKALDRFRVSLDLDQEYVDTYRRLGDLYLELGQYGLAIETLEQGLQVAPNDWQLHSTLGYVYAQEGNIARAIEHNEAVLQRRPQDLATLANLALLYEEAGDLSQALIYARAALDAAQSESERQTIQQLVDQLQQLLSG